MPDEPEHQVGGLLAGRAYGLLAKQVRGLLAKRAGWGGRGKYAEVRRGVEDHDTQPAAGL